MFLSNLNPKRSAFFELHYQFWTKKAFATLNRVCFSEDFSQTMIVMIAIPV